MYRNLYSHLQALRLVPEIPETRTAGREAIRNANKLKARAELVQRNTKQRQ